MRRSLAQPGVWLGLLGSLMVLAGCTAAHWTAPEFLATGGWAWLHALGRWPGRFLVLAGLCSLAAAFLLVHPRRARGLDPRWVAALWYVPMLVAPPVLSRDVYAYLDQGWLAANGNPYVTSMGVVSPFARLVDDFWRGTTTIYPPLTLKIQSLVVALGQGDVIATVLLMRLPVLLSLVVIAWLAPRVAARVPGGVREPDRVVWLALLNPLTVVHLVGGGHNDAVMVAGVVAACALATTRYGYVTGSLMAGVAMAVKQPGLMAAVIVALIAWPARTLSKRLVVALGAVVIALASFAAVTAATGLGFGWLTADGAPAKAYTQSPASLLRIIIKSFLAVDEQRLYTVLLVIGLALLGAFLGWLWLTRWRTPLAIGAFGYLAFAFLGPGLQPWYLLYGLVFLAMIRFSARTATLVTMWTTSLLVANWMSDTWQLSTLRSFGVSIPFFLVAGWVFWHWRDRLAPVDPV